jgi:uncharacterized protein
MIVVSDTSAITSLIQVGKEELLIQLYEKAFIPEAVRDELSKTHPYLPDFLQCQVVVDRQKVERLLFELDIGEAEAIVLAKELQADDLLIDECEGRRVAAREGLHVIGLLGVLLEAKAHGHILSVRQLTEDLERKAGFRVSHAVKQIIFLEAGEL